MRLCFLFFFKQKTAYEMRISDWSSDVCSSDLLPVEERAGDGLEPHPAERRRDRGRGLAGHPVVVEHVGGELVVVQVDRAGGQVGAAAHRGPGGQIGRASCRDRVGQSVKLSVVAESLTKQNKKQTYTEIY